MFKHNKIDEPLGSFISILNSLCYAKYWENNERFLKSNYKVNMYWPKNWSILIRKELKAMKKSCMQTIKFHFIWYFITY